VQLRNCIFPRFLQSTPASAETSTTAPHPKLTPDNNTKWRFTDSSEKLSTKSYMLRHPVYSKEELSQIHFTHKPVTGIRDRLAFALVGTMRSIFDKVTNYSDETGRMTEKQWLNRIVFLESVAGVPGMVGGMSRHLRSLRLMRRDNGWVHTLLQEAENERMHLLTFMQLKKPSIIFRGIVIVGQGIFFNLFFASYLLSPRICHRFVGYLEEEAVHTYTNCLKDIEVGKIRHWGTTPAPTIARDYWQLAADATLRDVVEAVRADEAEHRDVNHTLAALDADDHNPFVSH